MNRHGYPGVQRTRRHGRHREMVMRRDQGLCHLCGRPHADAIDHIVPVAWGGSDDPTNLAPAHTSCNSAKGASAPPDWAWNRPSMWIPGYGPNRQASQTGRAAKVTKPRKARPPFTVKRVALLVGLTALATAAAPFVVNVLILGPLSMLAPDATGLWATVAVIGTLAAIAVPPVLVLRYVDRPTTDSTPEGGNLDTPTPDTQAARQEVIHIVKGTLALLTEQPEPGYVTEDHSTIVEVRNLLTVAVNNGVLTADEAHDWNTQITQTLLDYSLDPEGH